VRRLPVYVRAKVQSRRVHHRRGCSELFAVNRTVSKVHPRLRNRIGRTDRGSPRRRGRRDPLRPPILVALWARFVFHETVRRRI